MAGFSEIKQARCGFPRGLALSGRLIAAKKAQ
jgi:hypothetical protein